MILSWCVFILHVYLRQEASKSLNDEMFFYGLSPFESTGRRRIRPTTLSPRPIGRRADASVFKGLAASAWHTAAVAIRLLVTGGLPIANGIIGFGPIPSSG
jgi:hypothetical protein